MPGVGPAVHSKTLSIADHFYQETEFSELKAGTTGITQMEKAILSVGSTRCMKVQNSLHQHTPL